MNARAVGVVDRRGKKVKIFLEEKKERGELTLFSTLFSIILIPPLSTNKTP